MRRLVCRMFSDTQLSSSVPSCISGLRKLKELELTHNTKLEGPLYTPPSLDRVYALACSLTLTDCNSFFWSYNSGPLRIRVSRETFLPFAQSECTLTDHASRTWPAYASVHKFKPCMSDDENGHGVSVGRLQHNSPLTHVYMCVCRLVSIYF